MAQMAQRLARLAEPEQHPAVAVDDRGIAGLGHARTIDQFKRLAVAVGAVGQGVPKRVQCVHVVRRDHQQAAEIGLGPGDVVAALPQQGPRIQQRLIVGEGGQPACVGVQFAGRVLVLETQFGLQQVGVALAFFVQGRVRLDRTQGVEGLLLPLQLEHHVGAAQASDALHVLSWHVGVPSQGFVVTLQLFRNLPQQQAAHRVRPGGFALELVVQGREPGLVPRLVQQGRALRITGFVLLPAREHLRSLCRIAEGIVFSGQRPAQSWRQARGIFQSGEQRPRLIQLATLAQQLRTQQCNPRLTREADNHLLDDTLHQRRLFQPLCQPAEAQPRLQPVRQRVVVDQLAQQRHYQLRLLADGTDQTRQHVLPAVVASGQQCAQFASGGALVAGAQGQGGRHCLPGLGRVRRQRQPQRITLTGQRILVGEQGNPGGAFGQHRIRGSLRGLQVAACSIRQLPGLQREFTGDAGFQRVGGRDLRQRRCRKCGHRRNQHGRTQQEAKHRALRHGHGGGPVQ